jgi:hypothetical protein
MINETTVPPLPLEKHLKICFAGLTINDGDFSSVNGLNPFKFEPERFNATKSPITSSMRAVFMMSSIICGGILAIKSLYIFSWLDSS